MQQNDRSGNGSTQVKMWTEPRGCIVLKQVMYWESGDCLFLIITVIADSIRMFLSDRELVSGSLCQF